MMKNMKVIHNLMNNLMKKIIKFNQ